MTESLVCWRCGAGLADQPLPLGREAECRACRAQLHVCRLCRLYAPHRGGCLEERAEAPSDPERANFCDFFNPRPDAFVAGDAAGAQARSALDALFGGEPPAATPDPARQALEDFFRK